MLRAVLGGLVLLTSGCGPDDGTTAHCRCTSETDPVAFPHCVDAVLDVPGSDPSSPFSTRVPDCPSGDLLFLREPTTPEAVLFNVRDTFEGFSSVQYVDILDDNFLFAPELTGLELYRDVYQPPAGYNPNADADTLWSFDQERRFAINLLDHSRFQRILVSRWYDASLDQSELHEDDPRRETYIFPYILDLTEQPDEDGAVRIFEVRGNMEVDLVTPSTENPVWSIRRWQDFRDAATEFSFTELRGVFAQ